MTIVHTSREELGQVYAPAVNAAMLIGCLLLVAGFRSSSALGAAYGVAMTGTMAITTALFCVIARHGWRWPAWRAGGVAGGFLAVEEGSIAEALDGLTAFLARYVTFRDPRAPPWLGAWTLATWCYRVFRVFQRLARHRPSDRGAAVSLRRPHGRRAALRRGGDAPRRPGALRCADQRAERRLRAGRGRDAAGATGPGLRRSALGGLRAARPGRYRRAQIGAGWYDPVWNSAITGPADFGLRGINTAVVGLLLKARPPAQELPERQAADDQEERGEEHRDKRLLMFWRVPPWLVVVITALRGALIAAVA